VQLILFWYRIWTSTKEARVEIIPYSNKKKYYPRGWKPERLKKSLVFIYAEKVTNGKGNSYFCVLIDVLWIYSISTTIGTAGTLPFTAKLRFNEQIVTSLYAIDVIDAN